MQVQKSLLREWEQQTLLADDYYHRGDLRCAFAAFAKTVYIMSEALQDKKVLPESIRCFVLACQNCAHTASRLGKLGSCEHYFVMSFRRLESLLADPIQKVNKRLLEKEIELAHRKYIQFYAKMDVSSRLVNSNQRVNSCCKKLFRKKLSQRLSSWLDRYRYSLASFSSRHHSEEESILHTRHSVRKRTLSFH
ncbi:MAG: hypothetical protein HWE27_00660 [Gammaproteobacteria bacterium]|nr:hypothetical protein [Gammaproteobacteria bacterium]